MIAFSTIVWANLIGVVLAALALGYWVGGRVADGHPRPSVLGFLVLGGALAVAAIPFVAKPFLDRTVQGLDQVSLGAVVGSFFSVLLLFAPPVVLLGMVSPFAVRLAVSDVAAVLRRAHTKLPLVTPVPEWLSPFTAVIPGQLTAMRLAQLRGLDIDSPAGLRKVTLTR